MTRIGDRIYVQSSDDILILRVKNQIGTVIITLIVGVFMFFIANTLWVFALAGIHGLFEFFGYSDFVFDKRNQVFSKRYGIGKYILGNSYQFQFEELEIKSKLTYDDGVLDLFLIQLISKKKSLVFYTSKNLLLIKKLYKFLETSGIKKLTWEIDEKLEAI